MLRRTLLLAALAALFAATPARAEPGGDWRGHRWGEGHGAPQTGDHGARFERGGAPNWRAGPPPNWANGDRRDESQQRPPQQDQPRHWGRDDAYRGVHAGRLRPLGDIIGELHGRFGGRLLGQELADEGGRTFYHIRWMTADGRRLDLVVPANNQ